MELGCMSLSGHFHSKWVKQDKLGREIVTNEDYRAARINHGDGSHALYRAGKMVPGSHEGPKQVAKKDVESTQSKFYNPTLVSTVVETQKQGEKETAGEKDTAACVRKRFDVNARALKL
jgi:hypothetical protein